MEQGCVKASRRQNSLEQLEEERVRMARQRVITLTEVYPGPIEKLAYLQKTPINMPFSSLPQSYTRLVCAFRNYERHYGEDSQALDSFLSISRLYFMLVDRSKSQADLNTLNNSYKGLFQLRKLSSMVNQKVTQVIVCMIYAQLVSQRKFDDNDYDMEKIIGECDRIIKIINKFDKKQLKIVYSEILALKVVCMCMLSLPTFEPTCYQLLKCRQDILQNNQSLFCRESLNRYTSITLQLALQLLSCKTTNRMIKATYANLIQKMMAAYCNQNYLYQTGELQEKFAKISMKFSKTRQINNFINEYSDESKKSGMTVRLKVSDTNSNRQFSLQSLSKQNKLTLFKALVYQTVIESNVKRKQVKPKKQFSYKCLNRSLEHRHKQDSLIGVNNLRDELNQVRRMFHKPKQQNFQILRRLTMNEKPIKDEKRASTRARNPRRETVLYGCLTEIVKIQFVDYWKHMVCQIQVRGNAARNAIEAKINVQRQSYVIPILKLGRNEQDWWEPPILNKLKAQIESSPLYCEFIHRLEGGFPESIMQQQYLSQQKKFVTESRSRFYLYAKQYVVRFIRWGHLLNRRLTGITWYKIKQQSEATKFARQFKEFMMYLEEKQKVYSSDSKGKKKLNVQAIIGSRMAKCQLLVVQLAKLCGQYILQTVSFCPKSIETVHFASKRLKMQNLKLNIVMRHLFNQTIIRNTEARSKVAAHILRQCLVSQLGPSLTQRHLLLRHLVPEIDIEMQQHYGQIESCIQIKDVQQSMEWLSKVQQSEPIITQQEGQFRNNFRKISNNKVQGQLIILQPVGKCLVTAHKQSLEEGDQEQWTIRCRMLRSDRYWHIKIKENQPEILQKIKIIDGIFHRKLTTEKFPKTRKKHLMVHRRSLQNVPLVLSICHNFHFNSWQIWVYQTMSCQRYVGYLPKGLVERNLTDSPLKLQLAQWASQLQVNIEQRFLMFLHENIKMHQNIINVMNVNREIVFLKTEEHYARLVYQNGKITVNIEEIDIVEKDYRDNCIDCTLPQYISSQDTEEGMPLRHPSMLENFCRRRESNSPIFRLNSMNLRYYQEDAWFDSRGF